MLQAALFELEGVLVDTRAARREALRRAFADEGVALAPAGEWAALADGLPVPDAVTRVATRTAEGSGRAADAARALDATALELIALRAARHAATALAAGLVLPPGAGEALDALAGALPLAVVTRATRREADALLAAAGLEGRFAAIVTADDVAAGKPSPEGHRAALARLARRRPADPPQPAHCVAFEDAWPGLAAARAAGLRAVLVGDAPAVAPAVPVALGADARVPALRGLTAGALAALLDLAPAPTAP